MIDYTTEYKGYVIERVFSYENGKGDFQVYKKDGDYGTIEPYVTLERLKEEIDERLEDNGN
jgi:hypothetical protein